jgi:hypothetical protein
LSYNLDEQIEESFEFTLAGHNYQMKYPTTEEILAASKIKGEEAQMEWMYGFITSSDEAAPLIKDVLGKVNVKKLQRFNEMVKTEFGVEGK